MSDFMVTTTNGARATDDNGHGMPEAAAVAQAQERNQAAEQLGIEARYVVAPFTPRAK